MTTEKIVREESQITPDITVLFWVNDDGTRTLLNEEHISSLLTTSYTEGFTAGVEKAREVLNELNKGKYGHMTREIRDTDQFYTDAWHMLDAREAAALTQLTSTNEVK